MATITNKWHALSFSAIVYYGTKYLDLGPAYRCDTLKLRGSRNRNNYIHNKLDTIASACQRYDPSSSHRSRVCRAPLTGTDGSSRILSFRVTFKGPDLTCLEKLLCSSMAQQLYCTLKLPTDSAKDVLASLATGRILTPVPR